jgi:hypothetical protein
VARGRLTSAGVGWGEGCSPARSYVRGRG